ncbi:unnamed protein product [Callosobruchus maculatus]|uniref:C2H2-type domain-containing protein n=1 Tax=Callosobruchus maculatus TaxID=64391 RepID=A0A653DN29_CALMS|nr:unnamed protein product [Callosobruchus maculatus]
MNTKNNCDFKAPHAVGSGFVCGDCGRTYKLKSSLRNHRKWECGKEPQFKCSHCSYKAKQKMHMLRHMERMHKDIELPNYADEAKIPEVLVKELNSRGITYTTTKVGCDNDIESALKTSIISYTDDKAIRKSKPAQAIYRCDRCNKTYKAATSLRRHQKVECGKSKNIVCKYCNHRFYYKQDWRCHMFTKHMEYLTTQDKSPTYI